jgi:cytochrome c oxidase accessory protein FixG
VLFELEARRFYVFDLVLYPQDFIYLAALLIISAYSLFLFTAVAGRLWCGYACPQTVYTEIFLWIEHKVEGDRSARMRLDAGGMTLEKLVKKSSKHLLWGLVAAWTGFTFVGYFTPIQDLGMEFLQTRMGSWEVFWVIFYGFATYGNAGFMREQVCKYMCPYARFQSAMFDHDTLIVTYDEKRGEPRGGRSRNADAQTLQLGACVDCSLCVQVCPTGIDIRNGLQYECIGCGACADVCDTVMDKMGYARGLVKYSTQNALAKGWTQAQTVRRIFRPRVLIYSGILILVCLAMITSLASRVPLRVNVERDRSVMARIVSGGNIENVYSLQLMNATESSQTYRITVNGLPAIRVASEPEIRVESTQSRRVAVRVQVPFDAAPSGTHEVHFEVSARDIPASVSEKSIFMIPR